MADQKSRSSRTSWVFFGGVAVGVATGLMLAPRSGREMRQMLSSQKPLNDYLEMGRQTAQQLSQTAKESAQQVAGTAAEEVTETQKEMADIVSEETKEAQEKALGESQGKSEAA